MVFNRTNRGLYNTISITSSYTIGKRYVSPVNLMFLRVNGVVNGEK